MSEQEQAHVLRPWHPPVQEAMCAIARARQDVGNGMERSRAPRQTLTRLPYVASLFPDLPVLILLLILLLILILRLGLRAGLRLG